MYDDDALINLVQKFSFLYDKTHKWYKNKNEREKGWNKIGDILSMSSEDCEQRWIILRNRFCTEMRKEKSSPTGVACRPWSLYEDLSFLKPHVIPRNPRKKVMHNDAKLIDLVHQYGFLYDKTDKWYKNEEEKEKAWTEIANTLNSTAESCEQCWGLLRNRFCTEMRKENSISTDDSPRLMWPLFENLKWLRPHVIPRRSKGSIPAPRLPDDWDTISEVETTSECIEDLDEETDDKYILTQPDNICETIYSLPNDISLEQSSQPSCSVSPSKRPKLELKGDDIDNNVAKRSDEDRVLGEAFTSALSQFTEIIRGEEKYFNEHRNDPDDLFGTMVAHYLKEIKDVKKKISIKSDILRIFENIL